MLSVHMRIELPDHGSAQTEAVCKPWPPPVYASVQVLHLFDSALRLEGVASTMSLTLAASAQTVELRWNCSSVEAF